MEYTHHCQSISPFTNLMHGNCHLMFGWACMGVALTLVNLGFSTGIPITRRNDGTAISKYIGRDSPQSVDNYPISTQNPTVIQRLDDFVSRYFVCAKCSARRKFVVGHSIFLSSLLLFSRPMYLLIAVPSAIPSTFRVPLHNKMMVCFYICLHLIRCYLLPAIRS